MRNAVLLFLVVAAVGCQAKHEAAAPDAATTASKAKPAAATPPAAAVGATGGEIGVAACDEYLNKWEACLATKVTGDAREQVRVALDASRDAWKRAAATPEGKVGLAAGCEQAAELAKMQVAAYGCTW